MATTVELRQRIPPKQILVVEDELVTAHAIRTVLDMDGHAVDVAKDGEEGLAMFMSGEHDVIIADFKLGKMDGLELAEAIKKHSPGTPVILITAYAEKIDSSTGEVSNVDVLLKKPLSVADLQQALRTVFPAL